MRRSGGIVSHLPFASIFHSLPCLEGVVTAVLPWRRLGLPPARGSRRSRKTQPSKAKAMLEVEVPDEAAGGEAVEAEAVAEGDPLRRRRRS